MKCINCGTDNKLKERTANQGRCIKCNHPFAFEPTSMSNIKITDPFFAKAIADISANNTLFFTPRQLLYFLDNRIKPKSASIFGLLFIYLFFNIWALWFIGGFSYFLFGNNSFLIVSILIEIRQSLSAEELAWLESGKFVELESFTPEKLIQVLQRGISGSQNIESDGGGLIFIGDAGNDMYIVQSFG